MDRAIDDPSKGMRSHASVTGSGPPQASGDVANRVLSALAQDVLLPNHYERLLTRSSLVFFKRTLASNPQQPITSTNDPLLLLTPTTLRLGIRLWG